MGLNKLNNRQQLILTF